MTRADTARVLLLSDGCANKGLAQIVLGDIELRLPDFTVMQQGRLAHARPGFRTPTLSNDMLVKPLHLFTIDWSLSSPGLSWPEAYHATGRPGYDVFAVMMSQDTDEPSGITDPAIGWFPDRNIFDRARRRIITRFWKTLAAENGQQKWEAFISEGRMDGRTVRKWAAIVRWNDDF